MTTATLRAAFLAAINARPSRLPAPRPELTVRRHHTDHVTVTMTDLSNEVTVAPEGDTEGGVTATARQWSQVFAVDHEGDSILLDLFVALSESMGGDELVRALNGADAFVRQWALRREDFLAQVGITDEQDAPLGLVTPAELRQAGEAEAAPEPEPVEPEPEHSYMHDLARNGFIDGDGCPMPLADETPKTPHPARIGDRTLVTWRGMGRRTRTRLVNACTMAGYGLTPSQGGKTLTAGPMGEDDASALLELTAHVCKGESYRHGS